MRGLARHFGCGVAEVCWALEKSRSWLYYSRRFPRRPMPPRRPEVEGAIGKILASYPATYGYRRIHALLLRQGLRANPKTIWRLMRKNLWLSSQRSHPLRPGRLHEGVVSVWKSNYRWASDITGIKAWDGTKGRLAVVIDCADRMILGWRFSRRIRAEDLCEILREAVFLRFAENRRRAQGIEFLTDNGPEYRSRRFRDMLLALGMIPCRTPIRSPQSNGVAEAFFGSLKRDYVYQSALETLEDIARQVPGWITDYNQVAPHSALGMRSPAQFYHEGLVKNK